MKIIKNTIQILFLAISLSTYSQSIVFNEIYDSGDSLYNGCSFVIELDNSDGFLIQMQYSDGGFFNRVGSKFIKIDEYGEVINISDLNNGNNRLIGTGILETNTCFHSLHAYSDPTENNRFDTYFVKLNLDLDTIYTKMIDIGYNDAGAGLIQVAENKLRFLSYYYPDSTLSENSQVVMVTIDTLGNILDQWEYGGPSYDFAYDYKQTNDGGYIIGGKTQDSITDDADLFLMKLDSNGTEEWYHKYGTIYEESIRSWNYVEITADGGYIIAADEKIITPFGTPNIVRAILIKTDENGVELWKKIYINNAYTNSKSVRVNYDETIILTGGFSDIDTVLIPFRDPRGYLHKYSPDGETLIWERFFSKFWLQHDYIGDMVLTSDGGILVSGYVLGVPWTRNDAWLVKFDSCGYTVGDIPEPMLIIDSIIDKTVYITDQSKNYCTAEIDWGDGTALQEYYAYEDNQPLAEKQFSHTYSQIDNYTIKTTTLAGEEFRSYEVQVLGLSSESLITMRNEEAISLFPNPANDYVIVQILNQVQNDGGFKMTISNLNGKQVKSINLNPKLYQQKVNVSSLNNGVYFVRFEVDGELVGTEKMVVAR